MSTCLYIFRALCGLPLVTLSTEIPIRRIVAFAAASCWRWLDNENTPGRHSGAVEAVAYYKGTVISASRDGSIKLSSSLTAGVECVLAADPRSRGHGGAGGVGAAAGQGAEPLPFVGAVYALLVYGDVLFSGSQNKDRGPLNVWCLKTRRHLASMRGHADAVMCLSLRGDRLYSGSWDSTVSLPPSRPSPIDPSLALARSHPSLPGSCSSSHVRACSRAKEHLESGN